MALRFLQFGQETGVSSTSLKECQKAWGNNAQITQGNKLCLRDGLTVHMTQQDDVLGVCQVCRVHSFHTLQGLPRTQGLEFQVDLPFGGVSVA